MARKKKLVPPVKVGPDPALLGPEFVYNTVNLLNAFNWYSGIGVRSGRPWISDWMATAGYSPEEVSRYSRSDSWRTSITMCAIARLLHQGCQLLGQEENFLRDRISVILENTIESKVVELPRMLRAKKVKQPKIKKVKTPEEIVSKAKFKVNDPVFGRGLHPTCIIGAKSVWTYNTKYLTLSFIIASPDMTLSFRGSTIQDIGMASFTKRVSDPEAVQKLVQIDKETAIRSFINIRGVVQKAHGRLGADTIILRMDSV